MLGPCLVVASGLMLPVHGAASAPAADPMFAQLRQCAPANYEAAVDCLDRTLLPSDRAKLAQPDAPVRFFIGIWIINNWGLTSGGPLYAAMRSRGFAEPADMTDALFDGVVARDRAQGAKPAQSEASR